ncbi:Hypothetical predicted protein [Octopus vulgaris]|uniref:Uncharacterized protein n=1 Tax=Octopus vulgaris TaxID=6645 RepID=A0AA36F2K0_OCTVU|nr:Hypothetical predicted protein [Octopus vulgaris]
MSCAVEDLNIKALTVIGDELLFSDKSGDIVSQQHSLHQLLVCIELFLNRLNASFISKPFPFLAQVNGVVKMELMIRVHSSVLTKRRKSFNMPADELLNNISTTKYRKPELYRMSKSLGTRKICQGMESGGAMLGGKILAQSRSQTGDEDFDSGRK